MKQVKEASQSTVVKTSARAVARFIRISPRKVRLVLSAICRKPVAQAFSILTNLNKKGARIVSKVLQSAVANAKDKQMDEARLFVRIALANGGPMLKRYLPRAMGRADTILKRTSHITVVVEEGELRGGVNPKDPKEKSSKIKKNNAEKAAGKKALAGV
ncbi:MAG: 50S ribosomal protein L22 [Candidatus Omnitrophica bacterium]|nr:50S ribosomal protein L22 [Candidatus Omnitrophota bacterium]